MIRTEENEKLFQYLFFYETFILYNSTRENTEEFLLEYELLNDKLFEEDIYEIKKEKSETVLSRKTTGSAVEITKARYIELLKERYGRQDIDSKTRFLKRFFEYKYKIGKLDLLMSIYGVYKGFEESEFNRFLKNNPLTNPLMDEEKDDKSQKVFIAWMDKASKENKSVKIYIIEPQKHEQVTFEV